MANLELEKISNRLKGVAGILLTVSESPDGIMRWPEWSLDLLFREVEECVELLDEMAGVK